MPKMPKSQRAKKIRRFRISDISGEISWLCMRWMRFVEIYVPQPAWNSISALQKARVHLQHLVTVGQIKHSQITCSYCTLLYHTRRIKTIDSLHASENQTVMKIAAKEIPEANVLVIERQIRPCSAWADAAMTAMTAAMCSCYGRCWQKTYDDVHLQGHKDI